MGDGRGKRAFVTVGTTKFDALIEAVDNLEVANELARQGFSDLIMQVGLINMFGEGCGRAASSWSCVSSAAPRSVRVSPMPIAIAR